MPWGMNCSYTWENANGTYSDSQVGQIKDVLGHTSTVTRFLISCLTALTLILVWWYSELERRLLVVKHHLCREMNLLCSPLAAQFILEGNDQFKIWQIFNLANLAERSEAKSAKRSFASKYLKF